MTALPLRPIGRLAVFLGLLVLPLAFFLSWVTHIGGGAVPADSCQTCVRLSATIASRLLSAAGLRQPAEVPAQEMVDAANQALCTHLPTLCKSQAAPSIARRIASLARHASHPQEVAERLARGLCVYEYGLCPTTAIADIRPAPPQRLRAVYGGPAADGKAALTISWQDQGAHFDYVLTLAQRGGSHRKALQLPRAAVCHAPLCTHTIRVPAADYLVAVGARDRRTGQRSQDAVTHAAIVSKPLTTPPAPKAFHVHRYGSATVFEWLADETPIEYFLVQVRADDASYGEPLRLAASHFLHGVHGAYRAWLELPSWDERTLYARVAAGNPFGVSDYTAELGVYPDTHVNAGDSWAQLRVDDATHALNGELFSAWLTAHPALGQSVARIDIYDRNKALQIVAQVGGTHADTTYPLVAGSDVGSLAFYGNHPLADWHLCTPAELPTDTPPPAGVIHIREFGMVGEYVSGDFAAQVCHRNSERAPKRIAGAFRIRRSPDIDLGR